MIDILIILGFITVCLLAVACVFHYYALDTHEDNFMKDMDSDD